MASIQSGSTVTLRRTVVDQAGAAINLSTASTKIFGLRDPKGRMTASSVSFVTDGTDGRVQLTTILTVAGDWGLQGKFIVAGQPFFSQTEILPVLPNLF